jgi:hypothetical protein
MPTGKIIFMNGSLVEIPKTLSNWTKLSAKKLKYLKNPRIERFMMMLVDKITFLLDGLEFHSIIIPQR